MTGSATTAGAEAGAGTGGQVNAALFGDFADPAFLAAALDRVAAGRPLHLVSDARGPVQAAARLGLAAVGLDGGPFDAPRIVEKYMSFAVPVLGEARAAAIRDAALDLTRAGSRFDRLGALLTDPV